MVGYAVLHFCICEVEGVVAAKLVVGEVVGEEDVKLGTRIIISHFVEEIHGTNSDSIARVDT